MDQSTGSGQSSARPQIVFVDAAIPACEGQARLDPVLVDHLRLLAVEGVLPLWSLWWGQGGLEELIPDGERRSHIEAELMELPMTLFEGSISVPVRWCEWSSAYLLLSEGMRSEAERARLRGWTVLERLGSHLDVVNRPTEVAVDLVRLVMNAW